MMSPTFGVQLLLTIVKIQLSPSITQPDPPRTPVLRPVLLDKLLHLLLHGAGNNLRWAVLPACAEYKPLHKQSLKKMYAPFQTPVSASGSVYPANAECC